ncbi:MAG: DMT family transporter [Gemmatimonas sp.]
MLRSRPSTRTAVSALLGGALLIALAPIFVRLSEVGLTATAFWRLALAAPILLAWDAVRRAQRGEGPCPTAADMRLLVLAGFCFAGDLASWHVSIALTSVANATLLANASPIFVAIAAWLWLRERPSGRFIGGLALASVGGVLLGIESAAAGHAHVVGDAFGLLTAVFYAGYMIAVKVLRGRCSTSTVMAGSSLVGAAMLLPLALLLGEAVLPTTLGGWATLIALAVLSQVFGQGLIAWSLGTLTASFGSLGLLTQTAGAAALAWVLFGEAFTILQSFGIALVVAGIIVARDRDGESHPLARRDGRV